MSLNVIKSYIYFFLTDFRKEGNAKELEEFSDRQ